MTILDAYAVIGCLRGEAAAEEVVPLLRVGDARLTAVGVAEVIDHLVRLAGIDEEEAVPDLAQLGVLEGIAIDSAAGAAAGRLRGRHYHRKRCAVSMADCLAAQTARVTSRSLATSDPHLLDLCHGEGISTTVLPGSDGSRWAAPES